MASVTWLASADKRRLCNWLTNRSAVVLSDDELLLLLEDVLSFASLAVAERCALAMESR